MNKNTYRIINVINGHTVMKTTDFDLVKARFIKLRSGYERRNRQIFTYVVDVCIEDGEYVDADVLDWANVFDKVVFVDGKFKIKNWLPPYDIEKLAEE